MWNALEGGQVCETLPNNLDLLCSPDYSCRRRDILILGLFALIDRMHTDMQITFFNYILQLLSILLCMIFMTV